MTKITLPQPDEMTPDVKLSDEQVKAINDFKDEPWEKPSTPAKADDKSKDEPIPDAEKKPEPKEVKEGEEEESVEKTPEEVAAEKVVKEAEAAETARLDKKAKELGKTVDEIKQIETTEKAETERLEKVAKDEGKTVDEVKAEEAKDKTVAERHGNDPVKIARALRKEQSEYGKLKNEAEGLRKFREQAIADARKFNEQRLNSALEKDREKIVTTYREKYKDEEGIDVLSDDAVFERAKGVIRKGLEERETTREESIKTQAETKRAEILKTLPEEFKDFIPEVKDLLAECGNDQILDKEFDVAFLANYARGKKYTSDYVKSLEESAYKRGGEKAKIIPNVPSAKAGSPKGVISTPLTEIQQRRAEELYGNREGWTKQKMYEEYSKNDMKNDF